MRVHAAAAAAPVFFAACGSGVSAESYPSRPVRFVVPARTPPPLVKRLQREIVTALNARDAREAMSKNGATPSPESPAELAAFIRSGQERIATVGRQAGITLD